MQWNAEEYRQRHSYVWKFAEGLIDLLDPKPGEQILDVGSGTGQLTAQIAQRGAAVSGIDKSATMVEAARKSYPEIAFEEADILHYSSARQFDAVFSNATLHWVRPPEQAAAQICALLRPGGRLVAEFGGAGNIAALIQAAGEVLEDLGAPALPEATPWYFPGIPEYSVVLENAGFEVLCAVLFDRPTPQEGGGEGLRNWLKMFGRQFTEHAPDTHDEVMKGMEGRLRGKLFSEGVWTIDYRRLRVVAQRRRQVECSPSS